MKDKSIRIQKLERVAFERASTVVLFELSDPRLEHVSVTRAELANDLSIVTLYWSVLGGDPVRSKVEHALRDAAPHVQREIAKVFHTRTCPRVRFQFDPSIAGAVHMGNVLERLAAERKARGDTDEPTPEGTSAKEE
jgi:ribosome-binding factor A